MRTRASGRSKTRRTSTRSCRHAPRSRPHPHPRPRPRAAADRGGAGWCAQDQIREREAVERAEAAQREEEATARREAEAAAQREAAVADQAARRASFSGEEPAGADTALVAFRLPNGERKQRRFRAGERVQRLYDYVLAFGDVEFDQFELCTNLPKVVYADREATIADAGLAPQAMLFVQEAL